MDAESGLLVNIMSTSASKFWDYLTKSGEVDFRISPTFGLKLRPQDRAITIITIKYGEEVSTIPIELPMSTGVLPLTQVILTFHGVLVIHAPTDAASTKINSVTGVMGVGGVYIISSIPGFIVGGKIGMIRQLNNFGSKILFQV